MNNLHRTHTSRSSTFGGRITLADLSVGILIGLATIVVSPTGIASELGDDGASPLSDSGTPKTEFFGLSIDLPEDWYIYPRKPHTTTATPGCVTLLNLVPAPKLDPPNREGAMITVDTMRVNASFSPFKFLTVMSGGTAPVTRIVENDVEAFFCEMRNRGPGGIHVWKIFALVREFQGDRILYALQFSHVEDESGRNLVDRKYMEQMERAILSLREN